MQAITAADGSLRIIFNYLISTTLKMNDTIIQDSINIAQQAISKTSTITHSPNWWMWIAIAELGIIALFLLKKKLTNRQNLKQKFKEESLKQEIDFSNIINSSFHSISLYDELKVKCHPDRFPNDEVKNQLAEALFQEITKNKTNLKRLKELKEEAKQQLNINF